MERSLKVIQNIYSAHSHLHNPTKLHCKCLGLPPLGVRTVLSLEISADAHVRGYVGENIKLKCTFKSSSDVTDKLTIDWTYRPPSSSRTESVSVDFLEKFFECLAWWHTPVISAMVRMEDQEFKAVLSSTAGSKPA